ncbi:hypothetical protein [Methanoregula sp.]|jgi:hypothetical protein|uniref:hypothetical protein n=1 Tax=Methanoregula sp. TaxID=2052170 RepID=UPI00356647B0
MPAYEVPRSVIDASLEELVEIYRWVHERESPESPVTVLIGGWAVYCYNPWYGSIDIDLVTNAGTRQHLMRHLLTSRGFIRRRNPPFKNSVVKVIPLNGEIIIDFIRRNERNCFEGRDEPCPMNLLNGRTIQKEISPGFSVTLPERSLLMILKLKAAWDRAYRIEEHTSDREDWEKGKLRKDRADILSLIDPQAGGTELDFMFLEEMLHRYPFLRETLVIIPDDRDALQMYTRMNRNVAQDAIENVLRLIE